MNEKISVKRIGLLLRADAISGYRTLLTVSAALAGIILVTAVIDLGDAGADGGFYVSWFGTLLFIWGAIASSRAFREIHDRTRSASYLLIPASAMEKTVARLLAVTAGLAAYLLVFMSLTALIVETLILLLFGERGSFFNPFDPLVWRLIPTYLFVQSFYFLGAAWFRKAHFIKTSLAVTLVSIGMAIFCLLTLRIVFAPYWEGFDDVGLMLARVSQSYSELLGALKILMTTFQVLLPATCWCIAWLRIKEIQVSDAV